MAKNTFFVLIPVLHIVVTVLSWKSNDLPQNLREKWIYKKA